MDILLATAVLSIILRIWRGWRNSLSWPTPLQRSNKRIRRTMRKCQRLWEILKREVVMLVNWLLGTLSQFRPGRHWVLPGCQLCCETICLAIRIRPRHHWFLRGRHCCHWANQLAIWIRPGHHWVLRGCQLCHWTKWLAIRISPGHHWVCSWKSTLPSDQSTGN